MATEPQIRRILIPINMTNPSRVAFYKGLELAAFWGSETFVLHVSEPVRAYDFSKKKYTETRETIERIEDGVRNRVDTLWKEGGVDAVDRRKIHIMVRGGKVHQEILDTAVAEGIDLIVIGIGSDNIAERVVRGAPCSILCVKPPPEDAPSA